MENEIIILVFDTRRIHGESESGFMPGIPSYTTILQLHGVLPSGNSPTITHLIHLPDQLVDVGLPVTKVTALDEVLEFPRPPATGGVGELERPKEVGCLP